MVPLQSVLVILIAIFCTGNSVELCDEPTLIITTPIYPCYSINDKILVEYIAPCVPFNTPFTLRACKARNETCEDIATVLSNGKGFTLIILDVCEDGLSYYLQFQTCDGVGDLIINSTVFKVTDSSITITSDLEPCYTYKDIIELSVDTECFPPGTHFNIYVCCVGNCVPVGCFSDVETCILIAVDDNFALDELNYIQIESIENYGSVIQRTPDFLVSSTSCRQNPSVTIEPLDDCYNYKETITIYYSSECVPINVPVIVQICTKDGCQDCRTIPSTGKSFDLTLVSPLVEKKGFYRIQIVSKDGTVLGSSTKFEVSERYLQITSKIGKCYNEKDLIRIDYETKCFSDDVDKLVTTVCCGRKCTEMARLSPKVNSFIVQVRPPMNNGETCFFIIQTIDGSKSVTTDGFLVSIKKCPTY